MTIKDLNEFSKGLEDLIDKSYSIVEEARYLLEDIINDEEINMTYAAKLIEKMKCLEDEFEKY